VGFVRRSDDGGKSWTRIPAPPGFQYNAPGTGSREADWGPVFGPTPGSMFRLWFDTAGSKKLLAYRFDPVSRSWVRITPLPPAFNGVMDLTRVVSSGRATYFARIWR